MANHRIILFGATGYTGRLVASELAGTKAAPFLLAGRDPRRLDRLAASIGGAPTAVAEVNDPASLERLIGTDDVVIDCAGPFLELGEPVVRACVDAGAHYLDTTGEQAFMKLVLDRYDEAARAAGSMVVNAMAFEYALGDCAAALAAHGLAQPLRSVDVVYSWTAAASASRGTLRSILRILASPGLAYADGEWRPMPVAAARTEVELPGARRRTAVAFPAGEVLTVPRHVEARDVRGWVVVGGWTARLGPALAPAIAPVSRAVIPLADRLLGATREGPSEERRGEGRFLIVVDARGAYGARRRVIVRGRDPYALTAAIAVRGARRMRELAERRPGEQPRRTRPLETPPLEPRPSGERPSGDHPPGTPPSGDRRPAARPLDERPTGVLAPAHVLEPRAFLDGLRDRGLDWEAMTA